MKYKVCSKCNVEKELVEFYKDLTCKGGVNSVCKLCVNKNGQAWHEANKEKVNKYHRERLRKKRAEDPEYFIKYNRKYEEKKKLGRAPYRATLTGKVTTLLESAKRRCRKAKLDFDLDREWILSKFQEQNNTCCLTGIEFDFLPCKEYKCYNPFSPSLDKIDANKGYTKDNVRLVCTAINLGMNCFGLDLFTRVCLAFIKHSKIKELK